MSMEQSYKEIQIELEKLREQKELLQMEEKVTELVKEKIAKIKKQNKTSVVKGASNPKLDQ